jgi:ABC-type lipoprotein export system ATPase subunit
MVRLENVSRTYPNGSELVIALHDLDLEVERGTVLALMGPSGSGKTTALNLIGGLDRPTAGRVIVNDVVLNDLNERQLTSFRAQSVGLVFQEAHLLPGLTALENVMVVRLPFASRRSLEVDARELLSAVGLRHRLNHPPSRLSGGEKQRVALARALIGRPQLLLADEPTGNLDAATTEEILRLLSDLQQDLDWTLVIATHDPAVAAIAARVVRLVSGSLDSGSLITSAHAEPRILE